MGPIGCPETSVTKYQTAVRKVPEDRRPHLFCGGTLTYRLVHLRSMSQLKVKVVNVPYYRGMFCDLSTSNLAPKQVRPVRHDGTEMPIFRLGLYSSICNKLMY